MFWLSCLFISTLAGNFEFSLKETFDIDKVCPKIYRYPLPQEWLSRRAIRDGISLPVDSPYGENLFFGIPGLTGTPTKATASVFEHELNVFKSLCEVDDPFHADLFYIPWFRDTLYPIPPEGEELFQYIRNYTITKYNVDFLSRKDGRDHFIVWPADFRMPAISAAMLSYQGWWGKILTVSVSYWSAMNYPFSSYIHLHPKWFSLPQQEQPNNMTAFFGENIDSLPWNPFSTKRDTLLFQFVNRWTPLRSRVRDTCQDYTVKWIMGNNELRNKFEPATRDWETLLNLLATHELAEAAPPHVPAVVFNDSDIMFGRPFNPELDSQILQPCQLLKSVSKLKHNTTEWEKVTGGPAILGMRRAVFCVQPPGDFCSRKGIVDSLLSGCIPVTFTGCSTEVLKDFIEVDRAIVTLHHANDIVDQLLQISQWEIYQKQMYIARNAHRLQYTMINNITEMDTLTDHQKFLIYNDAFFYTLRTLLRLRNQWFRCENELNGFYEPVFRICCPKHASNNCDIQKAYLTGYIPCDSDIAVLPCSFKYELPRDTAVRMSRLPHDIPHLKRAKQY